MELRPIHHNHSVCLLIYHFVACTKKRRLELPDNMTVDLFSQAVEKYPFQILVGEVVGDHIHLMIQAPATYAPAAIAKVVKGCSSKLIKRLTPSFGGWSAGYYISTTGGTAIDTVKEYIENQRS